MKKLICLVMVLAALVMGALPASVNAACGQYVQVLRVYTQDTGSYYVYGRPLNQVLPGYCYYWAIANDDLELLNTCLAAQASGKPTILSGDASTCPTTGNQRYGGALVYAVPYN